MALDPHDTRAVLHRLARRITRALQASPSTRAWRCRRVLPRVDGTARLDCESMADAHATLSWVAPPPPGEAPLSPHHWGALQADGGAEPLLPVVAGELTRSLARPAFALLPWVNRDRWRLPFDDTVVDRLLAGRVALGRTRWFDWWLTEVFQDESERFSLRFDGPAGRLCLQVTAPEPPPAPAAGPAPAPRGAGVDPGRPAAAPREAGVDPGRPAAAPRKAGVDPGRPAAAPRKAGADSRRPDANLTEAEPILRHRLFHLWLTADPRPASLRARVPHQVERFVGFLLNRAVHPGLQPQRAAADAAAGAAAGAGGAGPDSPGIDPWANAPVSTSRWGNPRQWRQFFSDFEVARDRGNLAFCEPVFSIVHGELECHRVEPRVLPRPHVFARRPFLPIEPPPAPGSGAMLNVLGERETVFGGEALLREAIERAMRHRGSRFVFVNNTCLPKLIGDDLPSTLAAARREGAKPVLDLNTDLDSPIETYAHLVKQLAEAPPAQPQGRTAGPAGPAGLTESDISQDVPDTAGVALLGYPPGPARDEIVSLLAARDIPVTACLGPELSLAQVSFYRRAALHVIYPEPPWPELEAALFSPPASPNSASPDSAPPDSAPPDSAPPDSAPQAITPPAPFGLRDSAAWLAEILAALRRDSGEDEGGDEAGHVGGDAGGGEAGREGGIHGENRAASDASDPALRARFTALQRQARDRGVGFVVDGAEVDRLLRPERCYGVRLLPLVEELGFRLTVLVRCEAGPKADAGDPPVEATAPATLSGVTAQLQAALTDPSRLTVIPFATEAELSAHLRQGTFELLYSEVACDARASRAGLTGFALDVFEPGPAGAVRTLERLLHAARWPFFRRYARYLPPRPEQGPTGPAPDSCAVPTAGSDPARSTP